MKDKRLTVIIDTIDDTAHGERIVKRVKPSGIKISDFMAQIAKELNAKELEKEPKTECVKEPKFLEKDRIRKA